MMRAVAAGVLCTVAALAGCGGRALTVEEFGTQVVTLPGGRKIRAEVMSREEDILRGMMFRDALAPDRGMLFLHPAEGRYGFWMYQVRIPLDIIWLDTARRAVEISANTPPCPSKSARECPTLGGKEISRFALELAGGMAAKYGVEIGSVLEF